VRRGSLRGRRFRRVSVEAGHSGKHRGARPTDSDHIFQLDESQRRFARDEDQRAAFFEVHIGGRAG
jgi:hypothetical protein